MVWFSRKPIPRQRFGETLLNNSSQVSKFLVGNCQFKVRNKDTRLTHFFPTLDFYISQKYILGGIEMWHCEEMVKFTEGKGSKKNIVLLSL